jgi:hypothetical protein
MKYIFKNKSEIVGLFVILLLIFLFSYYNFLQSLMKGRDVQRRNDLSAVAEALEKFYSDYDRYPMASDNGEIIACLPDGWKREDMKKLLGGRPIENREKMFAKFAPCKWGASVFEDYSAEGKDAYLSFVPIDTKTKEGWSYVYKSTGKHYQLYGSYEGKSMLDYSAKIVTKKYLCGSRICNFGKASRGTPLDMSLKEYENKLTP